MRRRRREKLPQPGHFDVRYHAHMSARLLWSVVVSATVIGAVILGACTPPHDQAARAREVERRILAPCCHRQTLEDHESEIAHLLRAEIQHRIAAGEPPDAIEDDLVRRYGEQVRAMPRTWDPRLPLGVGLGGVVLLGALVLLRLVSRWCSSRRASAADVSSARDLEYEDRLDDELLEID